MALDLTNIYKDSELNVIQRNHNEFLSLDFHHISRDGRIDSAPILPSFAPPSLLLTHPCNYILSNTITYISSPPSHDPKIRISFDKSGSHTSNNKASSSKGILKSQTSSTSGDSVSIIPTITNSNQQKNNNNTTGGYRVPTHLSSHQLNDNDPKSQTLSQSIPKPSIIPTHLSKNSVATTTQSRSTGGTGASIVKNTYSTILNNMMSDEDHSDSDLKGNNNIWSPLAPKLMKTIKSQSNTNLTNNHDSDLMDNSLKLTLAHPTNTKLLSKSSSYPMDENITINHTTNTDYSSLSTNPRKKTKTDPDNQRSHAQIENNEYDDMEGIPDIDPDADEDNLEEMDKHSGNIGTPVSTSETDYRELKRKTPSTRITLAKDSHFGQRDEKWLNEIRRRAAILAETSMWKDKEKKIKASIEKGKGNINLRGVYHPKPNQNPPKWRCCYYLDYRQEYLGAYTSILEAAVAYDYAVSFMRPHDIGAINGGRNRLGGKVIDINFPGTVSDCRVEPPIDPWPADVQEMENRMASLHSANIESEGSNTEISEHVEYDTTNNRHSLSSGNPMKPVSKNKRPIDIIGEDEDDDNHDEHEMNNNDQESDLLHQQRNKSKYNEITNDSSEFSSPQRKSTKKEKNRTNNNRPSKQDKNEIIDSPIVVRGILELLPEAPHYVQLPLIDLNDDTNIEFDEPIEAWLTAEKVIEPLPESDTYLNQNSIPNEPMEPYGGLIGPEPE